MRSKNIIKQCGPAIAILLALVLSACQDENRSKDSADSTGRDQPTQPIDTPAYYDSLLTLILELENAVFENPGDTARVIALLRTAYDSTSGAFLTAGKGTFNPDYPESAREGGRKRAAKYTGERWALYMKAWYTGIAVRFGTPIAGTITYSKELFSREHADTLYQLILIPVGSVVIDEDSIPRGTPKKR